MPQPPPPSASPGNTGAIAGAVLAVLAVLAVVVYLSVAGNDDPAPTGAAPGSGAAQQPVPTRSVAEPDPEPTAPASGDAAPGAGCSYDQTGEQPARPVTPPAAGELVDVERTAVLTTSAGEVQVTLDGAAAPCAVTSFVSLAAQDYFDDTPCHRLTTRGIFVLQCGDPTGSGSGGPGYAFEDENLGGATYPAGTVAMANAGPGTNGSQFFLVYADTQLPPAYTPFGRVSSGLEVVQAVADAGAEPAGDGAPSQAVQIVDVAVS